MGSGVAQSGWECRFVTDGASGATRLVAIDADGDGDGDLVGAGTAGWLFWYENRGGALAGYHSLGHPNTSDVAVVDLDGDGALDLLARDGVSLWWQAGTAAGLGPEQSLPAPPPGRLLGAGDLDGDGDQDVVLGDASLQWLENLGGATFGSLHDISGAIADLRDLAVADLDGDSAADVVAAGRNGVAVFLGDGTGASFTRTDPLFRDTPSVAPLDVDGDGDLDLGVADPVGTSWLENVGGRFSGSLRDQTLAVTQIQAVGAGDVDGDGDADLLTGDALDAVGWRESAPGGLGPRNVLHTGTRYLSVVAGLDLDADGDVEVVSAGDQESDLRWSEPGAASQQVSHAANGVVGAVAVDLDLDGILDVVDVTQLSELAWSRGLGTTFEPRAVLGTPNAPRAVVVADVDGDGAPDVVTAAYDGVWWVAASAGGPGAPVLLKPTNRSLWDLATGDFDADGDADLASIQLGGGVSWYENRGARDFRTHAVGYPYGSERLRATDADGDGDPDLVVSYSQDSASGGVSVYENDGGGGFVPHPLATFPGGRAAWDVGDLDGDGAADVVLGLVDGAVRLDGSTVRTVVATGPGPVNDLRVADLDADGDLDVVLLGDRGDALWYLENDGLGALSAAVLLGESLEGQRLELPDLDGDGDLDLLVPALVGDAVQWFVDPWVTPVPEHTGLLDHTGTELVHTGVATEPADHTAAPPPTGAGGPEEKGGCSCRSGSAAPSAVAGVLALLAARRRRPVQGRTHHPGRRPA
jgi:MYXO-CTERM domain-containing protein